MLSMLEKEIGVRKDTFFELVRFGVTGGSLLLLHLLFVYFLTSILGAWYLFAVTFSYVLITIANFFSQKNFVRQKSEVSATSLQFGVYVASCAAMLVLNVLAMYLMVGIFTWHYLVAQAIIVLVLALLTFFINRKLIFT